MWSDKWLENTALKEHFPKVYNRVANKIVHLQTA